MAWLYYRTAVQLCAGRLPLMALQGSGRRSSRRAFWPLLLLALPPFFYLWSMYSSGGTPIHVPGLWPHSYYNTRYGLAALPLLAFAAAALVLAVPPRIRAAALWSSSRVRSTGHASRAGELDHVGGIARQLIGRRAPGQRRRPVICALAIAPARGSCPPAGTIFRHLSRYGYSPARDLQRR